MIMEGGIELGEGVVIEQGAIIRVKKAKIGDRTIIRSGARIEGNNIELGTESYLDHYAWIGGGSCWDKGAYLVAGAWMHLGWNAQINIGRGVQLGEEVGIGIESKLFCHGAYLPADKGFPVQWGSVNIGNRVWLPNAIVMPNVMIGNDVVVAAGSLVNKQLPNGCFAAGVPAKVVKWDCYPRELTDEEKSELVARVISDANLRSESKTDAKNRISVNRAVFNLDERTIEGPVTVDSEKLKNQLRRNGIRFKYYNKRSEYVPWS
jgi:acetyltransferase-like isoleucine patch superfamily enzyme